MAFKQDAARSIRAFQKFVAPALRRFGARKILPTEYHQDGLARTLDLIAGVDGLIVDRDNLVFGYASRVQFDGKNYESFTIRRSRPNGTKTEFEKLTNPMTIKPAYHVQTFVDENESRAVVAIAETWRLIKYTLEHPNQWRTANGGETFYFVPWSKLDGVRVFVVEDERVVEKKLAA